MSFPPSSSSEHSISGDEDDQRCKIREDLSSMSFEEIMKLKDELGAKLYKEAILGVGSETHPQNRRSKSSKSDFKRLNKNRPREVTAKRQVPFLGAELRNIHKTETEVRDPRFDANSGNYSVKEFKENYKFLSKIRQKEAAKLKKQLLVTSDEEERKELKLAIQRLINKNVEERRWHSKQSMLKQEQQEVQQARAEGRQPHYTTNKERRAKELVLKFEQLKKTGKLNKHLEKRRKKNAAKDRKKLGFD